MPGARGAAPLGSSVPTGSPGARARSAEGTAGRRSDGAPRRLARGARLAQPTALTEAGGSSPRPGSRLTPPHGAAALHSQRLRPAPLFAKIICTSCRTRHFSLLPSCPSRQERPERVGRGALGSGAAFPSGAWRGAGRGAAAPAPAAAAPRAAGAPTLGKVKRPVTGALDTRRRASRSSASARTRPRAPACERKSAVLGEPWAPPLAVCSSSSSHRKDKVPHQQN